MKIVDGWMNSMSISLEIFKQAMVLLAAVGLGILSSTYSPLYALAGTALFCLVSFILYSNSFQTFQHDVSLQDSAGESSRKSFLFNLFYLSFFLSITIPKAGRTFSNVPVTVANLCIGITLLLWGLYAIFSQKIFSKIPLFRSGVLFILYGIFAAIVGGIKGSLYKYVILDFVIFIGFVPAYFLVCSVVKTKKQLRYVIVAVMIGMVLVSSYGILQPRLGFEKIAIPGLTRQYNMITYEGVGRWNVIEGGGQKVYSTFQNGNVFGNHLALFIPLLAGCLLNFSMLSYSKRILLIGAFFLACYTLLITYSRGALISTSCGIVFLAFLAKKIRLKAVIIALVLLAVVFIFIHYYGELPELTRYDFSRIKDDPNRFSAGRVFRIKFVLQQFFQYPLFEKLFGRGFGSGVLVQQNCDYTDNLYLTLLFKFGIIGVLLLLGIFSQFFREFLRLYSLSQDEQIRGIIAGGAAGMFAALIHYLVDTLWIFPPLAVNFWFLAGITMMAGVISSQEITSQKQTSVASHGIFRS